MSGVGTREMLDLLLERYGIEPPEDMDAAVRLCDELLEVERLAGESSNLAALQRVCDIEDGEGARVALILARLQARLRVERVLQRRGDSPLMTSRDGECLAQGVTAGAELALAIRRYKGHHEDGLLDRVAAYAFPRASPMAPLSVEATDPLHRTWAIRWSGRVWGREGWEWEPMPSSRTEAMLKRTRWTRAEALAVATTAVDLEAVLPCPPCPYDADEHQAAQCPYCGDGPTP